MLGMALVHKTCILLVLVIDYGRHSLAVSTSRSMTNRSSSTPLAAMREDTAIPHRGSPLTTTIVFVSSLLGLLIFVSASCAFCLYKQKKKTKQLEKELEVKRGRNRPIIKSLVREKLKTIPKGSMVAPAIYKPSAVNKERLLHLREAAAMSESTRGPASCPSATLTSDPDVCSKAEPSITVGIQSAVDTTTADSQAQEEDMLSVACETVRSFADPPKPQSPNDDSDSPPKKITSKKKKRSKKHKVLFQNCGNVR